LLEINHVKVCHDETIFKKESCKLMSRFVHFRDSNRQKGISVAYEIIGDHDNLDRTIAYGSSQCHDKDSFNRAKGRMIASNRLNHERSCRSFDLKLNSFKDVNKQVICAIRDNIANETRGNAAKRSVLNLMKYPSFGLTE